MRCCAISKYWVSSSEPMNDTFSRMAATPVDPDPMKGSYIVGLFGGDIRRTRYCMSLRGLTVGCVLLVSSRPALRSDLEALAQ